MRAVSRTVYSAAVGTVIVLAMVSIAVPEAAFLSGACCLIALVASLPLLRRAQRIIALVLVVAGGAFLLVAVLLGHEFRALDLLETNQDIVAMLAAVSFLGFVARTAGETRPRLRGTAAVVRTLGLTHVLGAVINLSAVTVVADHLRRPDGLRAADAQIVTRGFATSGIWSPFWAGAAIALALLPGANTWLVMLVGLLLAVAVLAATTPTILRALGAERAEYRGYALSWRLLRIPVALAVLVFAAHLVLPEAPMPRLIAGGSILVTAAWAALPRPAEFPRRFAAEARTALPGTTGETSLFVAAGLMAVGLNALVAELDIALPVAEFTVPVAWACIVVMLLGVSVGVHQVISIGLIAAVVLPLQPDPTLFMSAIMIGWGTSSAVGPLSGLQLYLQGRYGVPSLAMVRQNLPLLGAMLVLAWPALLLVERLA